jgi:hypothetical protein
VDEDRLLAAAILVNATFINICPLHISSRFTLLSYLIHVAHQEPVQIAVGVVAELDDQVAARIQSGQFRGSRRSMGRDWIPTFMACSCWTWSGSYSSVLMAARWMSLASS